MQNKAIQLCLALISITAAIGQFLDDINMLERSEDGKRELQMDKVQRPNFVLFFADDIGWGDLGANWALNKNVTPNLNRLAEEGLRLTDFHSAASTCTPSRASLLTGRLGLRTGVIHNFVPKSKFGLPLNETTVAEVLQANGYATGMIGKWHLGITEKYHPRSRGFDYYYGLPYSNDMGCVDVPAYNLPPQKECPKKEYVQRRSAGSKSALPLYESYNIVEQPADLLQLGDHYSTKASEFLNKVSQSNKPFFLYVALAHMHVPLAHASRFKNSTSLHTVYADTLHELDDMIGRIISDLKKKNLYENSVIWFTGDNGPWDVKCEYSGSPGPFLGVWQKKTYGGGATSKTTTWEAGHREPTLVVWPRQVAPNQTSNALTSTLDVFPTFLSLAGVERPKDREYDGIDLSNFLKGNTKTAHTNLFHPNSGDTFPFGEIDTVRTGPFKILWKSGGVSKACDGSVAPRVSHDPPLLFNVDEDPQESILLTSETFSGYDAVIEKATLLRKNLLENIKADNTSVTDYTTSDDVVPCCDPKQFLCRCKRDS